MDAGDFAKILGADFFTGVPDSQLRQLCDYLMDTYGIDPKHHLIAANEGNSVGLAAGYHLATGKVPVVYLQNSGEGNIINPLASLISEEVYAIPCIFIIGWRGEPGVHDEPQHIQQGKVTTELMNVMDVPFMIIGKDTDIEDVSSQFKEWQPLLDKGRQVAFIVQKGAFTYSNKVSYKNKSKLVREEIIKLIVKASGDDPIVSTTGKTSRELFEVRESLGQGHNNDFLTVGSMGHSSSIALGIAINKPKTRIWCIDGDGSALMHMGSMATVGAVKPVNLIHIIINNFAHESVGGMPTVANSVDFVSVAKACGYAYAVKVDTYEDLKWKFTVVKSIEGPCFIEIDSAIGSREDLGRPTTTPVENKEAFMRHLSE
ncbi:phosphonopyruvate decarboxylase [Thermoplasmatales archaeon BRNA1]|nr:phosphonopyruvate decarboxylase [Thermoplasmatales archaeon BRNA1]